MSTSATVPVPGSELSATTFTTSAPGEWGRSRLPMLAAVGSFGLLFAPTMTGLVSQWWNDPDAGHGLLLVPVALLLAWRSGVAPASKAGRGLGAAMLVTAVLLRIAGSLAAELFTQRMAMLLAAAGLVTFYAGGRTLLRWWLPVGLLILSIPLPTVVLNELALPLQFQASRMGAALLAMRNVPVLLSGNVINLPGHQLFVTEACSGLRSLMALLSLGLLLGGLWLRSPWTRALLLVLAVAVAVVVNGVRVFLTGFLVFFVSREMGEGFMHTTEGWLLFVASLAMLGLVTWGLAALEQRRARGAHA